MSPLPKCFFQGMDTMSDWGTLPLPSIKAKSVDEVLMEATVRNVKSHRINIKVCRIGLFEQA